jgi:large subunit ribosomal protein L3
MLGLLGKKKGMTQVFAAGGELIPVTVVELGPCTVVQKKTKANDGYDALQLGYSIRKPKGVTRPVRGHFEKKGLPIFTHLKEFRTDMAANFNVGEVLSVEGFKAGDKIHVSGVTKGRGFQGVIKRHGKAGGPAAHGSGFHRAPGSIGMRTWPGRVFKNTRLPGHMGDVNVTTRNLEVVAIRPEDNVILIRGAVPGCREGLLEVVLVHEPLESRTELKKKPVSAAKVVTAENSEVAVETIEANAGSLEKPEETKE